jgi:GDSL/SGNH-like Acyl-Esterase family found in Pmr5 and Cas1p
MRPFDGAALISLLGTRTLVFAGDSLSRQHFISTLCLLHASRGVALVSDDVTWSDEWPCHGTRNCVPGGAHSGFDRGCASFAVDGAPLQQLRVCNANEDQLRSAKAMRLLGPDGALAPMHDIVVGNLGVHHTVEELQPMVSKLLRDWTSLGGERARRDGGGGHSRDALPIMIYRETAPQHFHGSAAGLYELRSTDRDGNLLVCAASVDLTVVSRSTAELELLAGRVPMLAVNPYAAAAGKLHVAGMQHRGDPSGHVEDCTHWCLPGLPDVWTLQLYNYLMAHLPQLEQGVY